MGAAGGRTWSVGQQDVRLMGGVVPASGEQLKRQYAAPRGAPLLHRRDWKRCAEHVGTRDHRAFTSHAQVGCGVHPSALSSRAA